MTLGRQNVLIALFVAIPAALIIFTAINWLERRDRVALLERIAQAQLNEVSRDACENDPQWFLAGPRVGRPRPEERLQPDADVRLPRPKSDELPFEYFAYDEEFSPKSVAGARFPDDMKRALRSPDSPRVVTSGFTGKLASGLQTAMATGWTGSCSYLLFRQPDPPGVVMSKTSLFGGILAVCALVAWLAATPTTMRIRRLSKEAKYSSGHFYSEMVKVSGSDEISSLGAVYNDAAIDIRQRVADALDRELALRRYVETTTEDVVPPMQTLERQLSSPAASAAGADMRGPVRETHRLMMMLRNLASVTRLRAVNEGTPREGVDLAALVRDLAQDRAPLAAACGVQIDLSKASGAVTVQADFDLMQQAVANVLDNAIVYNRPGGVVRLELASYDQGKRFRLVVADNGPGVPDDTFAGLTANKRFRGDESRNRRPDSRGLGLALAREIADRFGMQLDLRQPSDGGFEAEFRTRTRA